MRMVSMLHIGRLAYSRAIGAIGTIGTVDAVGGIACLESLGWGRCSVYRRCGPRFRGMRCYRVVTRGRLVRTGVAVSMTMLVDRRGLLRLLRTVSWSLS